LEVDTYIPGDMSVDVRVPLGENVTLSSERARALVMETVLVESLVVQVVAIEVVDVGVDVVLLLVAIDKTHRDSRMGVDGVHHDGIHVVDEVRNTRRV
jgi:hypothetical protein